MMLANVTEELSKKLATEIGATNFGIGHDGQQTIHVYLFKRIAKKKLCNTFKGFDIVYTYTGKIKPCVA